MITSLIFFCDFLFTKYHNSQYQLVLTYNLKTNHENLSLGRRKIVKQTSLCTCYNKSIHFDFDIYFSSCFLCISFLFFVHSVQKSCSIVRFIMHLIIYFMDTYAHFYNHAFLYWDYVFTLYVIIIIVL